jgi:hypothetical protein
MLLIETVAALAEGGFHERAKPLPIAMKKTTLRAARC